MTARTLIRPLLLATLAALGLAAAAAADFRLERELALAPGGRFVLESDSGSIEIRGSERSGARVLVIAERDDVEERFTFSFEERPGAAVVEVERRGSWRPWRSDRDRIRFTVEVPRQVDLDLETAGGAIDAASIQGRVELRSAGGSIAVADIQGEVDAHSSGGALTARDVRGDVRLDTSGGSIHAEEIAGNLVAKSSGGSIHAAGVGGDASISTSGGSVDALEVGGLLEAHSSGGPVRASFSPGNGSGGSLTSSGGGITAIVDPGVRLDVHAHSSGGRVSVDLPITVSGSMSANTVRGSLNGGGPLLKLRSSGGPIKLRGS